MKTAKRIIFFACLLWTLFPAASMAADEKLSASFNKEKAFIGDIVEYKVRAELPENAYVNAKQAAVFNDFELRNIRIDKVSSVPNVYEITFELSVFKLGKLLIEPTAVFYFNPDGTNNLFFTPYGQLEIEEIAKDNQDSIRDIKPPKKLPLGFLYFSALFLSAALLIFLGFLIHRDIVLAAKKPVPIDPQKAALEALDETLKLKEKDLRAFYYSMSEILRGYISHKYQCQALEMTSAEFFEELKKYLPQDIAASEIKDYLKVFNLARYGAFLPGKDEDEKNFNLTKTLLERL
jgi:hypothetical protein